MRTNGATAGRGSFYGRFEQRAPRARPAECLWDFVDFDEDVAGGVGDAADLDRVAAGWDADEDHDVHVRRRHADVWQYISNRQAADLRV